MTERLIIRRFAGLDEVNIELGRINIFIGPQASGKSVCAKCLYLFKSFLPDFLAAAVRGQEWKTFETAFLDRFKEYFPGVWQTDNLLFLRYEHGDSFVEIAHSGDRLTLHYDEFIRRATYEIIGGMFDLKKKYAQPRAKWRNTAFESDQFFEEHALLDRVKGELHAQVGDMLDTGQLFILAGRSFFAALKGAMLSFLANAPVVDPFLKEFLGRYELGRRHQPDGKKPRIAALWALAQHILKGRLVVEGEEDFIVRADGQRVRLSNASSGQQEAFALLLLLINLVSDDDETPDQGPYTVYVEEPEAHLFPESQRAMAQLMATVYHESVFTLQYVITTHSPYLLAVFNNLVYAHQVQEALAGDPAALKKLSRVVPKTERLPLADFRAYGLENGEARPLINHKLGLLSADLLDRASDKINEQLGSSRLSTPAPTPDADRPKVITRHCHPRPDYSGQNTEGQKHL